MRTRVADAVWFALAGVGLASVLATPMFALLLWRERLMWVLAVAGIAVLIWLATRPADRRAR